MWGRGRLIVLGNRRLRDFLGTRTFSAKTEPALGTGDWSGMDVALSGVVRVEV